MANDRLETARERLRAALLAGEPTCTHRKAISALEAAAEAQRLKAAESEVEHQRAIAERAAAISAETHTAVASVVSRHPIPGRTQ